MKIMMIVARLNIGGVALNVVQLVNRLHQMQGVEVILVNGQVGADEGDMQYLVENYAVQQIVLPSLGREISPLQDLRTIWRLWRLMREHRPDVVHTHTAKAGWVGRIAAWLARVPVRVHTFHGHVFRGYFSPRKTQIFLWMERIAARLSSRIITLSDALRNDLAAVYRVADDEHISVIPLGLDLQPFAEQYQYVISQSAVFPNESDEENQYVGEGFMPSRNRAGTRPAPTANDLLPEGNSQITQERFRASLNILPDAPLIAVVGRLVPIKNHRLFLAAAQLLHQERPDVQFVIIGDGELRGELEQEIVRKTLSPVVKIAGWVQDTPRAYVELDVVTITSDNEGTPVSLIEAIVAGVPVVSTDVGGVRDLLGDDLPNALVAPNDADALAEAWQQTLDNPPDLTTIRARLLATYDISGVARQHLALYQSLLSE